MQHQNRYSLKVDEKGNITLPKELQQKYQLYPGLELLLDEDTLTFRLHRPTSHLARVYIEPTTHCNLHCITCIRNVWEESLGSMNDETYANIIASIQQLPEKPVIFFGGYGEPLIHPSIIAMVQKAKAIGARVELITNATLLDEKRAKALIEAGLDVLWISLDAIHPDNFEEVRQGSILPGIMDNLRRFAALRTPGHRPKPEIGISFVAMQRNLSELPELLHTCQRIGASRFLVTNVLPHTMAMYDEILYQRVLHEITYIPSVWVPSLSLPRIDLNKHTLPTLGTIIRAGFNIDLSGDNLGESNDRCPFIERGAVVIGWDGRVSPCLSLLHSHHSYLNGYQRYSKEYIVGNVNQTPLIDIWRKEEYVHFRQRVQEFDYAPCTVCGGCDLSERNEEDCYGNIFPTCGGCLWAQGIVQCP